MGSVKEVSDTTSPNTDDKNSYIDPAEYILKDQTYHDRVFVVGRHAEEAESMSVVTCYLASQSSVFRELLLKNNGSEIRITEVSPRVFNLILIHVYGGTLPSMEQGTLAQLALAARHYNIRPLLAKVSTMIVPKSAEDVFPALMCVAHMPCQNLDSHVMKIVQQETQEVLSSAQFLDLDAKCLEYICRQDKLSVTELELWRGLVRWAQKKVDSIPDTTGRKHLQTIMPYVRLNVFTPEEIGKEVIPTNILTAEEVMKLISAVISNQPWQLLGICSIREQREKTDLSKEDGLNPSPDDVKSEAVAKESHPFEVAKKTTMSTGESNKISNLTIVTKANKVEIDTISVESIPIDMLDNKPIYDLRCDITVSKIQDGFCKETFIVQIGGKVIGSSEIAFALKLRNEQPLVLEANSVYNFALEFNNPHPVYKLEAQKDPLVDTEITVKYNTPLHVKAFSYRI